MVLSKRTGKRYYVEPIVTSKFPVWGSINPATGNLTHKKGDENTLVVFLKKKVLSLKRMVLVKLLNLSEMLVLIMQLE